MELVTKSAEETKNFGKEVASNLEGGEVFALSGELGSGKTTFVQGFAEGLGIKGRIISPTFILMRKYGAGDKDFYHIDLYRLEGNVENEVINLGLSDIWAKPENIVVIEWAEKIEKIIPKSAKWIKFENLGGEKRKITIQ
ncbi:MAG: hypothetical protein UX88_C0009G0005 [Candidatus Woesebacteria bacterium GW2011_GWC2_47_16]|uniref:tRNA threonylcarbamoyladenosine biosynthesis protein TsaE n=6 Tax=Candidatus Woeseibacteriota TaxID=1752722 RepID=A0A0G1T008_9BACT|nr:MAG: hypothetical protein UX03_C0018G0005 [Candidatus Woesebacteria bacterium GW2011_GWE1_45_18]KKU22622.1 MAG: hypothetical protein UX34_C0025G0006 [Candidatus Woesebacteria bacterium GW2011_GWF1_46_13]KKU47538.1 MAG: hypothetical protein UX67_C0034G0003 [Candidatus Woesebacteria bacterium GW2011_GWF2_46_8]KKU64750.1 MAG: hypothetical protein UX88_C0009G0005 [Candidatus Woesebacteria bacterium GW2011_GWC2_47_16]KKU71134.1 MAG: hypothetical protein UX95_C0003G0005 [Candidatus Woesebacteria b